MGREGGGNQSALLLQLPLHQEPPLVVKEAHFSLRPSNLSRGGPLVPPHLPLTAVAVGVDGADCEYLTPSWWNNSHALRTPSVTRISRPLATHPLTLCGATCLWKGTKGRVHGDTGRAPLLPVVLFPSNIDHRLLLAQYSA